MTRQHSNAMDDMKVRTVFVAGPFFKLIDPLTGRMPPRDQALVEGLLAHFESAGARVFNAHRREKWGTETLPPDVFTKLDYDEIRASDLLVVMPGSPPSPGTHIELGWASAMGVPMVLLLDPTGEYSGMVTGMGGIVPTATVKLIDKSVDFDELDRAVVDVIGRHRRGRRGSSEQGPKHLKGVDDLSSSDIRSVLKEVCPSCTIHHVHAGPSSYSNRLWRAETDEGDLLVRVPGRSRDPEVHRQSVVACRLANDAGVPSPRHRAFAPHTSLGVPVIIQEFAPGERADGADVNLAELGQTLGAWVGRLHATRRTRFGSVIGPGDARPWHAIVTERVAKCLETLPAGALPADREQIQKAFLPVASFEVEAASLTHGDLYLDNVLVRDGRGTCLLDFEHAEYRDRFADFGKLQELVFEAHPETREPFLAAYQRQHPATRGDDIRLRISLGVYALSQLHYFHTWQPDLVPFYKNRLHEWLQMDHQK
jgi:aminoglycoside phosphotransferase (APT) family kinase protein